MSFLRSLNVKSDVFPESDVETSVRQDDVKTKFELYRSRTEDLTVKHREAQLVIDRLKEEIHGAREVEKSQRLIISSLQSRLSALEKKGKNLYEISEKQRNNTDEIRKIESNINNLTTLVQELKEKFQTVLSSTVKEIDVIRENKDLHFALQSKEKQLHILKTELKAVLSEKEDLVKKYEMENEELRKKTEISLWEKSEPEDCYGIINTYKQKILEYEITIEKMERERKSLLGDYDMDMPLDSNPIEKSSYHNDKAITWPDSTVPCPTEGRENKNHSMNVGLTWKTAGHCHHQESPGPKSLLLKLQKLSDDTRITSEFSKFKQKPKSNFLDPTNEASVIHSQSQPKKRLYSQNSNHYDN